MIMNSFPCPRYTVSMGKVLSLLILLSKLSLSAIKSTLAGFFTLVNKSPQKKAPYWVRNPIEPLECPGIL